MLAQRAGLPVTYPHLALEDLEPLVDERGTCGADRDDGVRNRPMSPVEVDGGCASPDKDVDSIHL